MVSYFAHICNASLETGEAPRKWRLVDVTPIYKKGDCNFVRNYQLINLTSIVGKTLKIIIEDGIREHLDDVWQLSTWVS